MRIHAKLFIFVLAVLMAFSAMPALYAGSYDSVITGAKFKPLVVFDKASISTNQLRGFCASPDGKFLFAGFLQDSKRVLKVDASTGKVLGEYKDSEPGYGKGLAADDRGNLYVGIANSANNGAVKFAVVDIATMKEIKLVEISISGKVGVNGVAVVKSGSKYYLYLVTNYDTDRLYCYDVTDTKNPSVKTSFGTSGFVDLQKLTGVAAADANYVAVDNAGVVYVAAKIASGSKGDTVLKIAADGSSIISKAAVPEAYGAFIRDEYLYVSTYAGTSSVVYVLNTSDLSTVGKIGTMSDATNYTGVASVGNLIYISDQEANSTGRILVSDPLSFPAAATSAATSAPSAGATTAKTSTATATAPKTADSGIMVSAAVCAVSLAALLTVISRRKARG